MMSCIMIRDLTKGEFDELKQDRRELRARLKKDITWKEYLLYLMRSHKND